MDWRIEMRKMGSNFDWSREDATAQRFAKKSEGKAPRSAPLVCTVLPTYNERENIEPLVAGRAGQRHHPAPGARRRRRFTGRHVAGGREPDAAIQRER